MYEIQIHNQGRALAKVGDRPAWHRTRAPYFALQLLGAPARKRLFLRPHGQDEPLEYSGITFSLRQCLSLPSEEPALTRASHTVLSESLGEYTP